MSAQSNLTAAREERVQRLTARTFAILRSLGRGMQQHDTASDTATMDIGPRLDLRCLFRVKAVRSWRRGRWLSSEWMIVRPLPLAQWTADLSL